MTVSRRHKRRTGTTARRRKRRALFGLCFYCEERMATTVDHMIPVSRGGSDSRGNLVGACFECNQEKADMLPSEYAEWKSARAVEASR